MTKDLFQRERIMSGNDVNKDRLLDSFLQLAKIDSESFYERDMADYLKGELSSLGIRVHEDSAGERLGEICEKSLKKEGNPAGNLWAFMPGNMDSREENEKKALLFCAHMDTVSPGRGKKARVQEGGRITSDGTTVLGADDLAGIAEILEVLHILEETDAVHPDIEILFTAAEEPYCQGSRLFDFGNFHSKTACILDMSGEVGTVALAAPCIYSLYIWIHGKSAHAGFCPEEGVHAIHIAAKAVSILPYGRVEEDTTLNLGMIEGGSGKNIVPGEVYLTGEIRSMDSKKAEYWAGRVRETFEKCAEEAGGRGDFLAEKEFDAYRVKKDSYTPRMLKKAAGRLGVKMRFVETFGGSDNNHFHSNGIEGVVLANAMEEVHTVREYTDLSQMAVCVELLLELIRAVTE